MKKKKLKKEIKELRKKVTDQRQMISTLGDKYVKLHTDLTKLTIKVNSQKALDFGYNDANSVEHQDNPYEESNYTSISTGYATYTAEDIRTCDNCKHYAGLPHNNGTMEYSGACRKCIAKDMWEAQNGNT